MPDIQFEVIAVAGSDYVESFDKRLAAFLLEECTPEVEPVDVNGLEDLIDEV